MFPTLRCTGPRRDIKIKSEDIIEVFCTCRMPEIDGIDMVQCDKCTEWYHVGCVTVPSQAMKDRSMEWFCSTCAV